MPETHMPRDNHNNPIPVLKFADGGAQKVNITASSARNAVAFNANTRVVSIYLSGAAYMRQGGASVVATATDHYIPANTWIDVGIGHPDTGDFSTHMAFLRVDTDCVANLSERS